MLAGTKSAPEFFLGRKLSQVYEGHQIKPRRKKVRLALSGSNKSICLTLYQEYPDRCTASTNRSELTCQRPMK
jgi:hypothetical protein